MLRKTWSADLARWLLVFPSVLAGCGGGANGSGQVPSVNSEAYQTQLATLQNVWGGISVTLPASLPAGGSATYSGVIQLKMESGVGEISILGAVSIDSHFYADQITGAANGFVDVNDGPYTGILSISGGAINRAAASGSEYTFSTNMGGLLTGSSDSFSFTGDLLGDFLGPGQLAMSGVISGSALSNFGNGYVFGSFIAAQ